MSNKAVKKILIGVLLIILGLYFENQLIANISEIGLYAIILVGAVLVGLGLLNLADRDAEKSHAKHHAEKSLQDQVLLNILGRGSNADSNIHVLEVEEIQRILKEVSGNEYDASDIRLAARSDLFETRSFSSYLADVSDKLSTAEKTMILEALAKVIKVDEAVVEEEVAFYNQVATAFKLSPAMIAKVGKKG